MSDQDKAYKVGYKNPPKHSQFKKGQPSANPRGRKRKSRNFSILLNEALQERVTVIKNGLKKKMTAQEAIAITMVANAIKGNDRAIDRVLNLFPEQHPKEWGKKQEARMEGFLNGCSNEELDNIIAELSKIMGKNEAI